MTPGPLSSNPNGGCWTWEHAAAHHPGSIIACHHPSGSGMQGSPNAGCAF
jgi:hypothetical protein